jgi:antitoxin CptB
VIDARTRERLLWHCRRGMLELDLLLQQFIEREFERLTDREYAAFERLLALPDPDLFDYCYGHSLPKDPELADLVRRIAP